MKEKDSKWIEKKKERELFQMFPKVQAQHQKQYKKKNNT